MCTLLLTDVYVCVQCRYQQLEDATADQLHLTLKNRTVRQGHMDCSFRLIQGMELGHERTEPQQACSKLSKRKADAGKHFLHGPQQPLAGLVGLLRGLGWAYWGWLHYHPHIPLGLNKMCVFSWFAAGGFPSPTQPLTSGNL